MSSPDRSLTASFLSLPGADFTVFGAPPRRKMSLASTPASSSTSTRMSSCSLLRRRVLGPRRHHHLHGRHQDPVVTGIGEAKASRTKTIAKGGIRAAFFAGWARHAAHPLGPLLCQGMSRLVKGAGPARCATSICQEQGGLTTRGPLQKLRIR